LPPYEQHSRFKLVQRAREEMVFRFHQDQLLRRRQGIEIGFHRGHRTEFVVGA
jgi:hypothetical protein